MTLRGRKGMEGENVNIEKHENRSADMERGRESDLQSGRGRPARDGEWKVDNKRKGQCFP